MPTLFSSEWGLIHPSIACQSFIVSYSSTFLLSTPHYMGVAENKALGPEFENLTLAYRRTEEDNGERKDKVSEGKITLKRETLCHKG